MYNTNEKGKDKMIEVGIMKFPVQIHVLLKILTLKLC